MPARGDQGSVKLQEQAKDAAAAPLNPLAAPKLPSEQCTFKDLGVSEWLERVCSTLGMKQPTQVRQCWTALCLCPVASPCPDRAACPA